MAALQTQPREIAPTGAGFAYLMTGTAVGLIIVSGVLGSIFAPDMVTGSEHEHLHIAAFTGWIFNVIAIGLVVTAAMQGIRSHVTDKAPWTMLGGGVSAIWLAVMFVVIFAPVWIEGTNPTKIPIWALLGAIVGLVLTVISCNFVKTACFRASEAKAESITTTTADQESAGEDATVKLRRLAQLRDCGAITEAEFQAKKTELLSRI